MSTNRNDQPSSVPGRHMIRGVTPIMENYMEKNMENEMAATAFRDYVVVRVPKVMGHFWNPKY